MPNSCRHQTLIRDGFLYNAPILAHWDCQEEVRIKRLLAIDSFA